MCMKIAVDIIKDKVIQPIINTYPNTIVVIKLAVPIRYTKKYYRKVSLSKYFI